MLSRRFPHCFAPAVELFSAGVYGTAFSGGLPHLLEFSALEAFGFGQPQAETLVRACLQLRKLRLSHDCIPSTEWAVMLGAMQHSLTELDVSNSALDDEALRPIAEARPRVLRALRLKACARVTDLTLTRLLSPCATANSRS